MSSPSRAQRAPSRWGEGAQGLPGLAAGWAQSPGPPQIRDQPPVPRGPGLQLPVQPWHLPGVQALVWPPAPLDIKGLTPGSGPKDYGEGPAPEAGRC